MGIGLYCLLAHCLCTCVILSLIFYSAYLDFMLKTMALHIVQHMIFAADEL